MSIEAHNYVIKLKVGNVTAKFVLDRLAERADERFTCFPSIGLLAAELEVSDRTVQRALSFLRDLSLVSDRVNKRPDGSQTTNRYQLHGPWDDYAGTGVPFPEIVTPKQARAEMWAQRPAEGEFREGTAAFVALAEDKAAGEEAAKRAAEAVARAEAAKESKSDRGRKAAAARRGVREGAGDVSAGPEGVTRMSPPPVTRMSPAPASLMSPLEPSATTHSSDDAASPRSGGDVRRTSTSGSSKAEPVENSGCAASSKDSSPHPQQQDTAPARRGQKSSSKGQGRHTREQLAKVQAVRAYFPEDLKAPDVPGLSDAILAALAEGMPESRTVDQIGARIGRRWYTHGWAAKVAAGETIRRPVGVARDLVRPYSGDDRWSCANPRCDEGADADDQTDCPACPERIADRRAKRRQKADRVVPREHPPVSEPAATVPKQAVDPMQCCDRCDKAYRGPETGLCPGCQKEVAYV